MTKLVKCLTKYENIHHTNIVVGDLNLPKINWCNMTCPGDAVSRIFLKHVLESSYYQVVNFTTHVNNILDVVLTSDTSVVCNVHPDVPFGASDHNIVKFNLVMSTVPSFAIGSCDTYTSYEWKQADYGAIEQYLSYVDWGGLITVNPSAPSLWDAFISVLRCTIDLYVPKFCNVSYHKGSRRIHKGMRKCLARKRCLWRQLCFRNNDPIVNHKYKECVISLVLPH